MNVAKKYIENQLIDHIIKGEGEISFLNLIKSLESGKNPSRIIEGEMLENLDMTNYVDRIYGIVKKVLILNF